MQQVGATKLGQQYLVTKAMLQSSTALNLAAYLLLKSDQAAQDDVDPSLIQSHPVIAWLQKWNELSQKLEDRVETKVPGLQSQLEYLVKAAALMKSEEGKSSDVSESSDDEDQEKEEDQDYDLDVRVAQQPTHLKGAKMDTDEEDRRSSDEEDARVPRQQAASNRLHVLNEARFGLRPSEVAASTQQRQGRRKHNRSGPSDFGDARPEDMNAATAYTASTKALASTINSIGQRSAVRQRRKAPFPDDIDEIQDDRYGGSTALDGLEMPFGAGNDAVEEAGDEPMDPELYIDNNDGDDFYAAVSKKAKSKKEARKNKYSVAPKFPRTETVVDGERAISRTIMKNRGLVPHKPKLNRNPRVKKREQYRKALIRRKGAVRDVRSPQEGYQYGGEMTGIKTNISKSRKL